MYGIYARQSVYKEDSISIETQVDTCKKEIKHNNDYKIYSDKGFSGKNTNRPAFKELLQDIEDGIINHIVVYKLDRVSRSIVDFSNLMEKLQSKRVEFISCNEKFDTSTPMGKAMLTICMAFAQMERETTQERVTDAYYSRCKKGFYMGGRVPYGFKLKEIYIDNIKTSMYEPIPEEVEQIQMIFNLYVDKSNSLGDIVKYLQENNIEHLRGSFWNTSRISEMLRNPCYVQANADVYNFFIEQGTNIVNPIDEFTGEYGCYLYSGRDNKTIKKNVNLKGRDLVLAKHKGIVSSEIWLKCRIRCLNNRQSTKTFHARNSWLLGKVKCRNCGYSLNIIKSNTKASRYFVCGVRTSTKGASCNGTGCTLYASELENTILVAIKEKLKQFNDILYNDDNKSNPRINQLKIELTKIEKNIELATKNLEKIILNPSINECTLKVANDTIDELYNKKNYLIQELQTITYIVSSNDILDIKSRIEQWDKLSFEDKQTIVDTLIKTIYINSEGILIDWYIE